jgi:hypothetical protein
MKVAPTAEGAPVPQSGDIVAFNYCVSFIDLLGQRAALRGQGLLPVTPEEFEPFRNSVKHTIAHIRSLQQQADTMMNSVRSTRTDSPLRASIPPELYAEWDEMMKTKLVKQYWSDGLVSFVCLGDRDVKCQMNGIFGIFGLAGSIALIGLGIERPVRGAIDVAWGVELRPGELYGAAIARAYELESEQAQYPRIVIGERTVGLLRAHIDSTETDNFSKTNRELAKICHAMLLRDLDGHTILHYLGDAFRDYISRTQHLELYQEAYKFVRSQYETHRKSIDSKLAVRYHLLLNYFDAHRPKEEATNITST